MPIEYPNIEDVQKAFVDALPHGKQLYMRHWEALERAVMNPKWEQAGDSVRTLQVHKAKLFTVRWEFHVDIMDTRSKAKLLEEAIALRDRLALIVDGQPVAFDTPKCSESEKASVTKFHCSTHGIIG